MQGYSNRSGGANAWFITNRGVQRFDGVSWSQQAISDGPRHAREDILLALSPDGATVAAVRRYGRELWIWREGEWLRYPFAFIDPPRPPGVTAYWAPAVLPESIVIAPGSEIWIRMSNGALRRFARDGTQLEEPPEPVRFKNLIELVQDHSGRIFLVSDGIGKESPSEPGVAIILPTGKTTILTGQPMTGGWKVRDLMEHPGIVTADPGRIWLPFASEGKAPRLLDLAKQQFTDALPQANCNFLAAVSGDGRVYARSGAIGIPGPLMVYTPTAPEPHRPLAIVDVPTTGSQVHVAMAQDGSVWAIKPGLEVVRFDGPEGRCVDTPGPPYTAITVPESFLPGHDNTMLVCGRERATLYQGLTPVASGNIYDLIEERPELFRRAFAPRPLPRAAADDARAMDVVADSAGNIWVLGGNLQVWNGQRWYSAREALENAGAPSGKAWLLSAAGDGSKVYVSDGWEALRNDRGFLCELRDGKLRLAAAPATCHEWRKYRPWRDPQGGVWLLAGRVVEGQYMAQPYAACIDHKGTLAEINDAGWPRLIDQSGCLWLAGLRDGPVPQEAIHICKQGKIVQKLQVPGRVEGDKMVSDRPGSVYTLTTVGLAHYVAAAPDFAHYELRGDYPVPDLRGNVSALVAGPPGYVTAAARTDVPRGYHLYLIELPKEP